MLPASRSASACASPPRPCPRPKAVLAALDEFRKLLPDFDRVSVGFPGIVKRGVTILAVNLHPDWCNFPLQDKLAERWSKPVRVGNDADIAGYGAIQGQGVELVLTLGTGLGSALFTNGHLVPGLELGHHPWRKKGMTYEDYLGRRGLDKYGKARWNDFLEAAIHQTEAALQLGPPLPGRRQHQENPLQARQKRHHRLQRNRPPRRRLPVEGSGVRREWAGSSGIYP